MLASRVQGTRMCEEEKTQCVFVSKVISYVWFYFFFQKKHKSSFKFLLASFVNMESRFRIEAITLK